MEFVGFVIVVIAAFAIGVRLVAGVFDHDRVRRYVRARGGRVLRMHWAPFGPGWFGEKSDRIYRVYYEDADGQQHRAHCKTSMWTGVYLTNDRVERGAPAKSVATKTTAGSRADWRQYEPPQLPSQLVRCRTCGGQVSTNADACPHCGEKDFVKRA